MNVRPNCNSDDDDDCADDNQYAAANPGKQKLTQALISFRNMMSTNELMVIDNIGRG